MRILLINPTTREYIKGISIQAQAPLGLLCLASVLRADGHKVKIYDHNVQKNELKDYLKFEPELVGFTSFTGPMIIDALHLSEIFCKHLEVPIVWGGVHASILPIQTVSNPNIDMCVVGEGEKTIVELANSIEKGGDLSKIRGLVWKKVNNGTLKIIQNKPRPFIRDLDVLPFPAWDLIDIKQYTATSIGWDKSSLSLYSIQSSRGCPFNCGFCYNTSFNQRIWRFKNPARVIEEIAFLKEKFKAKNINFKDDNFIVNKKRVMNICKGIYKTDLDINFEIDCRVDLLSPPLAKYLKFAGCDQIFFGVESGSPRILQFINKGITRNQAIRAIKLCKKLNIRSSVSFIIGFPTETLNDILLTQNFIYKLNPDSLLLKIFVPYPGSQLYDYVVKNKLFEPPQKLENWAITWTKVNYQLSEIPPNILNRLSRKIFLNYYIRKIPGYAFTIVKEIIKNNVSLPRMLKWGIKNIL